MQRTSHSVMWDSRPPSSEQLWQSACRYRTCRTAEQGFPRSTCRGMPLVGLVGAREGSQRKSDHQGQMYLQVVGLWVRRRNEYGGNRERFLLLGLGVPTGLRRQCERLSRVFRRGCVLLVRVVQLLGLCCSRYVDFLCVSGAVCCCYGSRVRCVTSRI